MSNQDEREMEAFQQMLNQASTTAQGEKAEEERNYTSHLDNIKEKFAETVKTPLEALSGPLLFENAKEIISKGVKKVLGSSVDADTTKAVSDLVEKGDVKGFTNHLVNKLTKKHNVEDIMARDSTETDKEGFGSMIRSKLSKVLGDVSGKTRVPQFNMSEEINHISSYQNPFSTGLDKDLVDMATKGDLAGARATLGLRQSAQEAGGTADSFVSKLRNVRSLASDGLTNNQSSFQIGDAIRAEQAKINQTTEDIRGKIQSGIDQAKQKVAQLNRTDENAPNVPTEPNQKPSFNPSEEQAGADNIEDLAGAHSAMEEGETRKIGGKIFKKAGERMLEVDAETGGGADVFGDIAGAVVGLGSLIAGLFSHKRNLPKPPPIATITPTVEFGV